jgi:hypothetical protein
MSRKQRKLATAAARNSQVACPAPEPKTTQPDQAREDLRRTYLEKFQPADDVELDLIEEMISAQWRQRCLATIEEAAFAKIMSPDTPDITVAFEVNSKALAAIERSRKSYALQFSRALATLKKLRSCTAPPKPTPVAPVEATAKTPAPVIEDEPQSLFDPFPETIENRPHLE